MTVKKDWKKQSNIVFQSFVFSSFSVLVSDICDLNSNFVCIFEDNMFVKFSLVKP